MMHIWFLIKASNRSENSKLHSQNKQVGIHSLCIFFRVIFNCRLYSLPTVFGLFIYFVFLFYYICCCRCSSWCSSFLPVWIVLWAVRDSINRNVKTNTENMHNTVMVEDILLRQKGRWKDKQASKGRCKRLSTYTFWTSKPLANK